MMSIFIAGIVMGIFYFIMELDWSYWIYVAIYVLIYTFGLFASIALEISFMDTMMVELFFSEILKSYMLYTFVSIICYALIGMAVVYILNTMKGSDKKTFVSIGVMSQFFLTILVNYLLSNLIG